MGTRVRRKRLSFEVQRLALSLFDVATRLY